MDRSESSTWGRPRRQSLSGIRELNYAPLRLLSDPPRTRTENLLIKSQLLCQIELAGHVIPVAGLLSAHVQRLRSGSFYERPSSAVKPRSPGPSPSPDPIAACHSDEEIVRSVEAVNRAAQVAVLEGANPDLDGMRALSISECRQEDDAELLEVGDYRFRVL